MKETDLAQIFVKYFDAFDLYFEVDYYRSVDIVAISEKTFTAIEVKTTFNFKVLEQAIENSHHFNYSYIAVPAFIDWNIQGKLCEDYGLGLLFYYGKRGYNDVREVIHPKLNRHVKKDDLIKRLHECNKRSLPGSKSGDTTKITAFGVTVDNAVRYVERHPECSIKEMVEGIDHHYHSDMTARRNLYTWILRGVVKQIKLGPDNKLILNKIEP